MIERTLTIFNILREIELKGGFVYMYSRVPNSTKLDVVVTDDSINIHALNIEDSTQPNLQDFKYAKDKIQERLGFVDDGEIKKGSDNVWFMSLSLENIDYVWQDVEMHENKSISDGYGGVVAINEQTWVGNVGLEETRSNMERKGNSYEIITNGVMLVPKDLYVKKNNFFMVNGIKYVVNGIVENKVYVSRKY